MEILSSCVARFGIRPCGKLIPLKGVGLKSAGVQGPTFRSKVSQGLGAPVRRMKMQYLADPTTCAYDCALTGAGLSSGDRKYPATPAPAILKKLRRPSVGPTKGE